MSSNDWMPGCPLTAVQQRAFLYQQIRLFFAKKGVLEVETPVLSSHANSDTQIDVFQTQSIKINSKQAFLRTSPEFFHKRLLASGSGDIFEIAKVFRLGEASAVHNPEFTMLEWYRLGFDLRAMMAEVAALISVLFESFEWPQLPVRHVSYAELFRQYVGGSVFKSSLMQLNQWCRQHGYHGKDLERNAAMDFLFAVVIEPALPKNELLFVYHFPASQAALAQINPQDCNSCLRFELLWNGVELANGYQELTDANEQRQRFESDQKWRQKNGKPVMPLDAHLLDALDVGLPACSGVAVGLDRLLMHLIKASDLSAVLPFPSLRA